MKYVSMLLFGAYLAKGLYFGVDYPDALVLTILGALSALSGLDLIRDKRVALLQQQLNNQQIVLDKFSKEAESMKAHIASLKLSTGYRTLGQAQGAK